MKSRIISYAISLCLFVVFCATPALAIENFPSFPMSFSGKAMLDGLDLPKGTKIQVYSGAGILIAEQTMPEKGVYAYNDLTKARLLVGSFSGELVFKYMLPDSVAAIGGVKAMKYEGLFVSGAHVSLDLNFTSVIPPTNNGSSGGGGGGGGSSSGRPLLAKNATSALVQILPPLLASGTIIADNELLLVPMIDTEEQVLVLGVEMDLRTIQMEKIFKEAELISSGTLPQLLENSTKKRDLKSELEVMQKYTSVLVKGIKEDTFNKFQISNFILYGTMSTQFLGVGERAGVVSSYRSAFSKLPSNESEWRDVIKIANGRWPGQISTESEERAKEVFKKIYLRGADMNNPNDNAAVSIMAYGLRPVDRKIDSEQSAFRIFKNIFRKSPVSASDWDYLRAIAYSGTKR